MLGAGKRLEMRACVVECHWQVFAGNGYCHCGKGYCHCERGYCHSVVSVHWCFGRGISCVSLQGKVGRQRWTGVGPFPDG